MLIGLLTALLILDGLLLILLIMVQKGKGGMGLGALGGGAQMLFGGSGGQDLFQKITWFLGTIFMAGSLGLAIATSKGTRFGEYMARTTARPVPTRQTEQQSTQTTTPATTPEQPAQSGDAKK